MSLLLCHGLVLSTELDNPDLHKRCVSSAQRANELGERDHAYAARMRNSRVAVPAFFHEALARLKTVARLPAGVRVELVGSHGIRNAFVLNSGLMVVSSTLWQGKNALDREEAAAVIAHEIAHLEHAHVKDGLCEAVALAGDETLPLADATQAVHRAIWAGDHKLSVRMMQGNHQRELQADRRAVELLKLVGIAPDAMPRLFLKLSGSNGDYTGTHPDIETRLENLGVRGE